MGPRVVLVKGGTSTGPESIDVACTRRGPFETAAAADPDRDTRTAPGCTLSSAIAANLALGLRRPRGDRAAREYLDGAIRHAPGLGRGHGPLEPLLARVY